MDFKCFKTQFTFYNTKNNAHYLENNLKYHESFQSVLNICENVYNFGVLRNI